MKLTLLLVSLLLTLQACTINVTEPDVRYEDWPPTAAGPDSVIAARTHDDIQLPAKILYQVVVQTLIDANPDLTNLLQFTAAGGDAPLIVPAANTSSDTIETDWQPVPGKTSGILFWKKEWQTEVRHRITLFASILNPTTKSSYKIESEVRERPNSSYPWKEGWIGLAMSSEHKLRLSIDSSINQEIAQQAGNR